MRRDKSIELLNKAIGDELQAVHQYMFFHFHLDDLGYMPLAELLKRTAIEEMGHIEKLAERVLFLKGEVELVASSGVEKITDPEQMLNRAMSMEEQSAADYNASAIECNRVADSASKQAFEKLVMDEERHYDAFEKQLENIRRFGVNYLALQSFPGASGKEPEDRT
jgi:bacterioferritin